MGFPFHADDASPDTVGRLARLRTVPTSALPGTKTITEWVKPCRCGLRSGPVGGVCRNCSGGIPDPTRGEKEVL